jgi:hypothetical protein
VGPALERLLDRIRARVPVVGGVALVVILLAVGPGWALLRADALDARRPDGRLADPMLESANITAGVRRHLAAAFATPEPPPAVVFLQATRVEVPEGLDLPEHREVIFASPVHIALDGANGPRLMLVGRATARWTTLLDDVDPNALVLLDAGDRRVYPLGPVENARLYAALIAVAAGQFDRARHELWSAIDAQGTRVRFAFDSQNLPITEAQLDAQAAPFAYWLKGQGSPSSLRILKLFGSLYESVRGRELLQEGWGEPLPAGRIDD